MNKLFAALIVAAVTLFAATQAVAVPVFDVRFQAGGLGGTTQNFSGTVAPGGLSGFIVTGPASVTGPLGNDFTVLPPTGFSGSFELQNGQIKLAVGFGTGSLPSGVNHDAGGAGTYTVALTLTDIMVPSGQVWDWANAFSGVQGVAGIMSSIDIYLDPGNAAFATTTQLADLGSSFTSAAASEAFSLNTELLDSLLPTSPFSMTAVVTVSFPGMSLDANNAFSASVTGTAVPEPASLALLGAGLLVAGCALRRRAKRSEASVAA